MAFGGVGLVVGVLATNLTIRVQFPLKTIVFTLFKVDDKENFF